LSFFPFLSPNSTLTTLFGIAPFIFLAFSGSSTKAVYKYFPHLILNLVALSFVLMMISNKQIPYFLQ